MITSAQVNQLMMQQMSSQQQLMEMAQQQNMMGGSSMMMGPAGPYTSSIYGAEYEGSAATAGVNTAASWTGGFGAAPLYLGQGAAELHLGSKALTGLAGREVGGLAGFGGYMAMSAFDPFDTGGIAPWAGVAGMAGVLRSRDFMAAGEKGLLATGRGVYRAAMGGTAGRAALMRGATVGGGLALAAYLGVNAMSAVVDFTAENLSEGARQLQSVTSIMSDPQRTLMPGFQGSTSDASQTLSMFRQMDIEDPSVSTNQLIGLAGGMMQSGQFRHVQSAEEFRKTFQEKLQTMKEVASVMNTTLEEATQFMQQQSGMGLYGASATENIMFARGMSRAGGLSAATMMQGAAQGANIARAYGVRGRYGAVSAEYTMGTVGMAERMEVVSEEDLTEATGGLTGGAAIAAYSNKMQQRGFNFLQRTGRGRILSAALMDVETGGINEQRAQMFASGALDWSELRSLARENLSTREGRLKFRNRRRRIEGQIMEEVGPVAMMGQQAELMAERYFGTSSLDDVEREEFNDILRRRFTGMSESEASMLSGMVGQGQQIRSRVKQEMSKALAEVEAGGQQTQQLGFNQILEAVSDRVLGPLKRGIQQVGVETTQALSEWYNENFLGVSTFNVSQRTNRDIQRRALGMNVQTPPLNAFPAMGASEPGELSGYQRYVMGGGTDLTVGDRAAAYYESNKFSAGPGAGILEIGAVTTGNLLTQGWGWTNALAAGAYDELMGNMEGMSSQEARLNQLVGAGSMQYGGRFTESEQIARGPTMFGEMNLGRGIGSTVGGLALMALGPVGVVAGIAGGGIAGEATQKHFEAGPRRTMYVDPRTQTAEYRAARGNVRDYERFMQERANMGPGQLRAAEAEYARIAGLAEARYSRWDIARMQVERLGDADLFTTRERAMTEEERNRAAQSRDRSSLEKGTVETAVLNMPEIRTEDLVIQYLDDTGTLAEGAGNLARIRQEVRRSGSAEELGLVHGQFESRVARQRLAQGEFTEENIIKAQYGTTYDRAMALASTDPDRFRQEAIQNFAQRAAGVGGGGLMRLTASAFGGGAVPASAEQAQALARGKYGQMGTALLESGVASEIQNAGTPEGQRQIWQRFLTDQYNAGNITTQEFARLGATDPSGLLKELGPVDDIGRYVEARRAMELQYKTYQNRSSGLSYLRGGSAAQELVEGLYANQNVAGAKELDPVRQEQMWDDMTQMAIDDPERAAELASALEESGDANSIMVASVLRGSQQKYRKIGKIAGRRGSRTLESEGDVADILRLGVTDPRARAFIKQVQKDDHLDLMSLTQLSRLADLSDDNPQQKAYIQELQRALADDKVIDEKEQLRLSRFASQVPPELSGQYSVGAGGPQFMAEMTRFAESNQKLANALTEYEREKAKS